MKENNKLIAEFMIKQKPSNDFAVTIRDKEGFWIYTHQRTVYFKYDEYLCNLLQGF